MMKSSTDEESWKSGDLRDTKLLHRILLNTNLHIWATSDQKAKPLITSLRALTS